MNNTLNVCLGHQPFPKEFSRHVDLMIAPQLVPGCTRLALVDDARFGPNGSSLSEYGLLFWLLDHLKDLTAGLRYVRIIQYRRFTTREQPTDAQRSTNQVWAFVVPEDDIGRYEKEFDRQCDGELFNTPQDFGQGGMLAQYAQVHILEDLLNFTNFLIRSSILDSRSASHFLTQSTLIPACNIGVLTVEHFREIYGVLRRAAEFVHSPLFIKRSGYQRRNVGFLLERLQSFLILSMIQRGECPAAHGFNMVISDSTFVSTTVAISGDQGESPAQLSIRGDGSDSDPGRISPDHTDATKVNAYGDWLAARVLTDAKRKWVFEEIEKWSPATPSVRLAMFVLPGQESMAADTLFSLQAQLYRHWRMSVLSFEPVNLPAPLLPLLANGQIELEVLGDDDDSIESINAVLMGSAADWVGQLWPGDRLATDALFRLLAEARMSEDVPVLIYCDEDTLTRDYRRHQNPLLKPDANPDLLRSYNYVGQFFLTSGSAFKDVGGYVSDQEGSEEYGLLLSLLEKGGPRRIAHVSEVMYHRHEDGRQTHLTPQEHWDLCLGILAKHVRSCFPGAEVTPGALAPLARIKYPLLATPRVTIIVPTRDHPQDLKTCLESVFQRNAYPDVELIIVDHETTDAEARSLIDEANRRGAKILPYQGPFNFSEMMNRAVEIATGHFILLLNNDVIAHDEHWLEDLVRYGLRKDVGVVGPKLLHADGTVQHAGVLLGIGNRPAAHPFFGGPADEPGYMLRAVATQGLSAVTGACLLMRRELFQTVDGLDAEHLKTWYQDIDLCLKVRKLGLEVVYAADVVMTHRHGNTLQDPLSKPALSEHDGAGQVIRFCRRWTALVGNDPAYNKNLGISSPPFTLEMNPALTLDQRWKPRPRVFAFPIDHHGCGEYRIKAPMRQLTWAGQLDGMWTEYMLGPSDILRTRADVLVFQRHDTNRHHDFIKRCEAYSTAVRIIEIDDFLHGYHQGRRDNRTVSFDEAAAGFETAARMCDRLVVSTGGLAEEYGHLCTDVRIVPNFIEDEKWRVLRPRRRQSARPRVGWAGGSSHFGDLLILEEVVKVLASEVDWVFLGICPESLRPWVTEWHNGVPIDGYPMKLASLDLDLALAPLEYCRFNECKSALRLLEYGVLGYPVVCTDIVTFDGDFPVIRVSNSADDWISAIRAQIADRDELARSGDRMRDHIRTHWLLENNLDIWRNAWSPD